MFFVMERRREKLEDLKDELLIYSDSEFMESKEGDLRSGKKGKQ